MPNLVTYLNMTSMLQWYVIRCGSKIEHQKYTCLKEIGLHAQNVITITHLTFNIIEMDMYDHIMSTNIFALVMYKIFI